MDHGEHRGNGWSEYQRLVLSELKRLDTDLHSLRFDEIRALRVQLAQLSTALEVQKVKIGIWGALGASIPVGISLVVQWMSR